MGRRRFWAFEVPERDPYVRAKIISSADYVPARRGMNVNAETSEACHSLSCQDAALELVMADLQAATVAGLDSGF